MVDFKEYFYNSNRYLDSEIKKFIYDNTDKFNPFLLIGLNKDFVNFYVNEMELKDEYTLKDDYDIRSLLSNLIDEDQVLEINDNILVRIYSYSNGSFEIKESRHQLENLNFRDYNDLHNKIRDFQFCIQEIVEAENSKVIKQYYTLIEPKDQDLMDTETTEISYLGQPTNDKANDLFEFLIQFYRPDEKTSVKYVNILHYLKKDSRKELYVFKVKQEDYKKIIKEKEGVLISKFQKSEKYNEEEKHILNTLETTFRNQKR